MAQSLHQVAINVNTARSVPVATLRSMLVDRLKKAQGARLKDVRIRAGYRSARDAALSNDWPESTYRAHESGTRTIGQDDAERYATRFRFDGVEVTAQGILFGDDDIVHSLDDGSEAVQVKGIISAGGLIETSDEQTGGAELVRVTIPFKVPEGTIAFRVAGLSMHPRYDPDDVVLCSEYGDSPERLVGLYAAVQDAEGNRYLKRLLRGTKKGLFHLESHNATLMPNVKLTWASGIIITVHEQHWRRVVPQVVKAIG